MYDCTQELTLETSRSVPHSSFDLLEKIPTDLHIVCSPKLLIDLERMQGFKFCLFKSSLSIPNTGLKIHRASHVVFPVGTEGLGLFDVGVCIVELVVICKQLGQC